MTDRISIRQRSENMRKIRDRDTTPELLVRRLAHAMGYRFRLHCEDLPGKPDLVFRSRRRVIFVHGCFWHQHSSCPAGRVPSSNTGYWQRKLQRNVERDAAVRKALHAMGWDSLVLWECQIKDELLLRKAISAFLEAKDETQ